MIDPGSSLRYVRESAVMGFVSSLKAALRPCFFVRANPQTTQEGVVAELADRARLSIERAAVVFAVWSGEWKARG